MLKSSIKTWKKQQNNGFEYTLIELSTNVKNIQDTLMF